MDKPNKGIFQKCTGKILQKQMLARDRQQQKQSFQDMRQIFNPGARIKEDDDLLASRTSTVVMLSILEVLCCFNMVINRLKRVGRSRMDSQVGWTPQKFSLNGLLPWIIQCSELCQVGPCLLFHARYATFPYIVLLSIDKDFGQNICCISVPFTLAELPSHIMCSMVFFCFFFVTSLPAATLFTDIILFCTCSLQSPYLWILTRSIRVHYEHPYLLIFFSVNDLYKHPYLLIYFSERVYYKQPTCEFSLDPLLNNRGHMIIIIDNYQFKYIPDHFQIIPNLLKCTM